MSAVLKPQAGADQPFTLETSPEQAKKVLLDITYQLSDLIEHVQEIVLPDVSTGAAEHIGAALLRRATALVEAQIDVLGAGDEATLADISRVVDCLPASKGGQ